VTGNIIPFNPLDRKNLGASVADALIGSKVHPLGGLPTFLGEGIYAIYYTGNFSAYAPLAQRNANGKFEAPIYVGKAVPKGSRKGGGKGSGGKALFDRLIEHAESIVAAPSLNIADFHCRYLVVEDIWIPLGESLLIAHFAPVWNQLIDGFGNHDPGSKRYDGLRPRWDVLHPGRGWAAKCAARTETAQDIARDVEQYFRNTTLPSAGPITTPDGSAP